MKAIEFNKNELANFNAGQWCNLQKLVLNFKTDEERRERLNELDFVNYNGCGVRWFNPQTASLNDNGRGVRVEISCWSMRKL